MHNLFEFAALARASTKHHSLLIASNITSFISMRITPNNPITLINYIKSAPQILTKLHNLKGLETSFILM